MAIDDAWKRIERWLAAHHPQALKRLQAGATAEQLIEVESQTGLVYPEDLRWFYLLHNGERHPWPDGLFGDGLWFLPLDDVVAHWRQVSEDAPVSTGEENWPFWRKAIEEGEIFLSGPIKPVTSSARRLPIAETEYSWLYLDFDPAPGGQAGQVVLMDVEGGEFRVLADSFPKYLARFAQELEAGCYAVEDSVLHRAVEEDLEFSMPAYLADVMYPTITAQDISEPLDLAGIGDDQTVELIGDMGQLDAIENIVRFVLLVKGGEEYLIFATPKLTQGYESIAVGQYAWVKARKFRSSRDDRLLTHSHVKPDLIALEYAYLEGPENLVSPAKRRLRGRWRHFLLVGELFYKLSIGLLVHLFKGLGKMFRTPEEIHLRQESDSQWLDDGRARELLVELEKTGFERGQIYRITEIPRIKILSLFQESERLVAVLYQMDGKKAWVDLYAKTLDGREITVTNSPFKLPRTFPEGVEKTTVRTQNVGGLWEVIIACCPRESRAQVDRGGFRENFQAVYKREMAWHKACS